jgi:hypothetical protein
MHMGLRQARLATRHARVAYALALLLIGAVPAGAQSSDASDVLQRVTCVAASAERTFCPGDASAGVVLIKSNGPGECLLGRTWGYDQTGVWVTDGCSGEFALGASAQPTATTPAPQNDRQPTPRIETWGDFDPGDGFLVERTSFGELAVSGYGVVRFIDQTPGSQAFVDHLGTERTTDGRNDVLPHRIIIYLKGWLGDPKMRSTGGRSSCATNCFPRSIGLYRLTDPSQRLHGVSRGMRGVDRFVSLFV